MSDKSILEWKSKYLSSIRIFTFFILIFYWNWISEKSLIKEDRRNMENSKADYVAENFFDRSYLFPRSYWHQKYFSKIFTNTYNKCCCRSSAWNLFQRWLRFVGFFLYITNTYIQEHLTVLCQYLFPTTSWLLLIVVDKLL